MTVIIAVALALVAVGGALTTFTVDPMRQTVVLSIYGLLMAVVFVALDAPDVALSQIGVGSAIVPLIVLLSVRKIRARR
ncbi:MAG TPA: DUF4040 domain-containing protein [Acidimicrobiales bacterium]|jgi:uncharacterized MnhB-related membrane protein|nr:DUF4040 domain-containing protein [Acidimicrobiales bacterium]